MSARTVIVALRRRWSRWKTACRWRSWRRPDLAEQHFTNIALLRRPGSRWRCSPDRGHGRARGARAGAVGRDQPGRRHALVQGDVTFKQLGLVVIDEQHRFGVLQRATLRAKGLHPDVLVMTATPIPRTLALTVYGDLDVSMIRELPAGRLPIKTTAGPESRRDDIYQFIRQQLDAGRQAYVIYPLVEESAKIDLKAATEMADHLATDIFPAYKVGLLHGRMKATRRKR
jgi:RecG-like helicase